MKVTQSNALDTHNSSTGILTTSLNTNTHAHAFTAQSFIFRLFDYLIPVQKRPPRKQSNLLFMISHDSADLSHLTLIRMEFKCGIENEFSSENYIFRYFSRSI